MTEDVPAEAIIKAIKELFAELSRRGYKENLILELLREVK